MKKKKVDKIVGTRHEISEDELQFRQFLQEEWRIKPSKKAVKLLEERLVSVLTRIGIDCTKEPESVKMQMDIMGVFINSLSEENVGKAAGLYISAPVHGTLAPYAYISSALVKGNEYQFPIMYFVDDTIDEGTPARI